MDKASYILKLKEPGELFSDPDNIKTEYKSLAKIWHPDLHNGSNEVMKHINELYTKGLELIELNLWKTPGLIKVKAIDGRTREIHFRTTFNFELGVTYIADQIVAYFIKKEFKDLFDNGKKAINNIKYADSKMEKEFLRYLPQIIDTFETSDNQLVMVIKKTKDLLLLRDVLKWYKNQIPDRHVAWIQSRLYNLACYLEYSGISHNGISIDNYYISPKFHGGALLGGWWYAVPCGNKMVGTSKDIYEIMSPNIKNSKIGDIHTDLEAIRAIGRELLGNRSGTKLLDMKIAPDSMINWLRSASNDSAIENYSNWQKVLDNSFGVRKFVEMSLTAEMLYNK